VRKRISVGLTCVALAVVVPASSAFANPSAPTNGGNGAGKSGQCTGPASERPAVCPGA